MRTLVVLVFSMLMANMAHAGIVVWLHEEVPDDRMQNRANARTGGTRHMSGWDLMFPPMAPSEADQQHMDALRNEVSSGKKRWNDFEVEFGIATDLEKAIDGVDVIRNERDLQEIVEAMLFQGAAVQVAFEPDEMRDGKRAEPFRIERTGGVGNRPWADAVALLPERNPLPSDVADGGTFPDLSDEVQIYRDQPTGKLVFPRRGGEDTIVVDGVVYTGDQAEEADILPGRHFVHVLRNGKIISGRRVVRVEPGRETQVLPYVKGEELAAARGRVLADTTTGFPESVRGSLERMAAHYGGEVFVAAYDDKGAMVVLPWGHGAALLQQRVVTVVGTGEIGGAILSSPVFDDSEGRQVIAPGAHGSLGMELGIYNAVLLAGADLTLTPGKTITYANKDSTANIDTSTFAHPWGGVGLYVLRPTGHRATVLVAGHYAWLYPAHHGIGGRFSLGVPFEPGGSTWLRFTVGATGAPRTTWDTAEPMVVAFLRMGLAARF